MANRWEESFWVSESAHGVSADASLAMPPDANPSNVRKLSVSSGRIVNMLKEFVPVSTARLLAQHRPLQQSFDAHVYGVGVA